jgi:hypothetical protein
MLTNEQIADAAKRLDEAERTRTQIGQLSLQYPAITIDDAYAVQKAWVAAKIAAGRRMIGHKIGLTSKAMQQASQISEPDFGTLLDDMRFADGTDIPMARFIAPMVEVELAFILGKRLEGDRVTMFDVLSATDYVVPAMEIIDARIHRLDPDSPGDRDHRRADPSPRSGNEAAAQGVRHDLRQRGQCRDRHGRPADQTARCRPALGRGDPREERRRRGRRHGHGRLRAAWRDLVPVCLNRLGSSELP